MKLLLDSHVLLWWQAWPERLSPAAIAAIQDSRNAIWVSSLSFYELAFKQARGHLRLPPNLNEALLQNGFHEMPVRMEHALDAANLPMHHGDPIDRLLIAQARQEECRLVTRDNCFKNYAVECVWA